MGPAVWYHNSSLFCKGEPALELSILHFIQRFATPLLDHLFLALTVLGEPVAILVPILVIYYCCNKKMGLFLAFSCLTSHGVNSGLKALIGRARPIGQPGVRSLRTQTAGGSSLPSGHTQGAVTLLYSIYKFVKQKAMLAVAVVLGAAVALSRLYLGLHWPTDVVAGFLLAVLVSEVCYRLFITTKRPWLLFAVAAAALFLLAWPTRGSADFYKLAGAFVGLAAGAWFEDAAVRFTCDTSLLKKLVRLLLGGCLLWLLAWGLDRVLPATAVGGALRYGTLVFAAIGFIPLLFKKLSL